MMMDRHSRDALKTLVLGAQSALTRLITEDTTGVSLVLTQATKSDAILCSSSILAMTKVMVLS